MPPSPASGTPVHPAPESGDDAWFAQQFTLSTPELYAVALRLTRNTADAEDLVADAIARAWRRRGTLHDHSAFRAWIFRILTNTFVSTRRSVEARTAPESLDTLSESDGGFSLFDRLHQPFLLWWGSPEQDFLNKLLREDLERALAALPEHFRLVVTLADVHGLRYQEIAHTIDAPIGTVRSRLARGRALLQKALWEHGIDAGLVNRPKPNQGRAHG